MANIKLTELSELTNANNTNTIFYVADLSVSPNVSHYMRLGTFTSDNAIAYLAYSVANLAFARANTSLSVGWNANIAFNQANAAFAQANNGFNVANAAFNQANNGFNVANVAFNFANSAASFANGAFTSANNLAAVNTTQNTNISSAESFANGAFVTANSAASFANGAFTAANNRVLKAGDTITGVVVAPTAANTTSNTMLATTQFVNNHLSLYGGVGVGQTWTDVKSSRANNALYTNSTNKPICVYARAIFDNDSYGSFILGYVGSSEVGFSRDNGSAGSDVVAVSVSFVVPVGQQYKVVHVGQSPSFVVWNELR